MKIRKSIFLAMILSIVLTTAHAASLDQDRRWGPITIRGEIKTGDAEKFVSKLISDRMIDKYGRPMYNTPLIKLNSSGGDVVESQKIAAVIKSSYLDVWVGDGKKKTPVICASSCFLIYLAGKTRYALGSDIQPEFKWSDVELGIIGIHRPYFANPKDGPESSAKQESMMLAYRQSLRNEGLSQRLIDEMMERPSNSIYWLTEKDVESIGKYKPGLEEQLIARCKYRRTYTLADQMSYVGQDYKQTVECISNYVNDTYTPLTNTVFEKLRLGWRPW